MSEIFLTNLMKKYLWMMRIFHIVNKKDENYVYYLVVKNPKKRRKLKGLTQREFADVLDIDIRELFKPINDDK